MDPSEYECAICHNLLLDPVVGPCGHDFCQSCLARWRTNGTDLPSRSTTPCPLCREPIPGQLGVCLRLRETIQRCFPEEIKKRQLELQEREPAQSVTGGDSAAQRGAAVVRTPSAIGSPSYVSVATQFIARQIPRQHAVRLAPSFTFAPGAATAAGTAAAVQPLPSPGAATAAVDTWMPPATLCFSLGWYDPAETRGRRSLGRRRRAMAA